jgi:hypothetical protein
LFFVVSATKAQYNGFPIRNYSQKEYNAFMQNWYCVQDKRGVLYFGNSSNVLEYDGKNWRKIPIVKGVAVRSLSHKQPRDHIRWNGWRFWLFSTTKKWRVSLSIIKLLVAC